MSKINQNGHKLTWEEQILFDNIELQQFQHELNSTLTCIEVAGSLEKRMKKKRRRKKKKILKNIILCKMKDKFWGVLGLHL